MPIIRIKDLNYIVRLCYNMGVEYNGFDEFTNEMLRGRDRNPKEIKRFLKTYGRVVAKDVKKQYDSDGVGKKTGNLRKGVKVGKVYVNGGEHKCLVRTARHGHLIEYGHEIVGHKPNLKGTDKFTRAFHSMEKSKNEKQYSTAVEKWINTVLKKGWK